MFVDLLEYPGVILWIDNELVFPAILSVAFNLAFCCVVLKSSKFRSIAIFDTELFPFAFDRAHCWWKLWPILGYMLFAIIWYCNRFHGVILSFSGYESELGCICTVLDRIWYEFFY